MPQLNVNGVTVNYRESGAGVPVVLLHSGASSGAQWRQVAERIGSRFRMVTMDLYGHGGTGPWPGAPGAFTHQDEAVLVREVMRQAGGPVHLVGHSYSGSVALHLALEEPATLRSLTVIEPFVQPLLREGGETVLADLCDLTASEFIAGVEAGNLDATWERYLDESGAPGTWARTPPEARARFLTLSQAVAGMWYANQKQRCTRVQLRACRVPTLALHGERTQAHFRRMTELAAEAILGARLGILPEAGHMSPVTHPEAVAAALEPFLAVH